MALTGCTRSSERLSIGDSAESIADAVPSTMVCFGDSTTASRSGVKVFAAVLQERFAAEGRAIHVINAGVPGNNTREARGRFDRDVLGRRPDVVTIWFGINDSAVEVFKNETEPRVSLRKYEANLTWMVAQLQERGIRAIVMTPNPVAWTAELRKLYSKPPYRPDDPDGWNVLLQDYAGAVRRVAREQHAPLIDIYQLFEDYAHQSGHQLSDLMIDGMHPASSGHRMIAAQVMQHLSLENCKLRRHQTGGNICETPAAIAASGRSRLCGE